MIGFVAQLYPKVTLTPLSIRAVIFSSKSRLKNGWKRYTEPSTPTVTNGRFMWLRTSAIAAAVRYAALNRSLPLVANYVLVLENFEIKFRNKPFFKDERKDGENALSTLVVALEIARIPFH